MPSINVKTVKVPASDLRTNDVFMTVLRGEGPMLVTVYSDKRGQVVVAEAFDGKGKDNGYAEVAFAQTVRKVVGLKFVPAVTASEQ